MSQRRPQTNVVNFSTYANASRNTKLSTIPCRTLPVDWSRWPAIATKSAQLHASDPAAAEVIEKLLDDLLAEVS